MSIAAVSVRTYARYVVPLTVLSALVFGPLLYLAWRAKAPLTVPEGRSAVRMAWAMLGLALPPLLVLVGGVAPAVRAIAAGRPASQLRVLDAGVRGLVRAALPAALATIAVLLGMLALVVPGLVLLVLFAMTGASPHAGVARLADAAARARTARTALVIAGALAATLAVHAAVLWFAQRGLAVPLPPKPKPPQLAELRVLLRVAVTTIAVLAPIPAVVLAAVYDARAPAADAPA